MTTSHKLFLSTGIIISIFAALTLNAITTNSSAQGISTSNTSSEDQGSTCSPIYMNKSANTTSRNLSEANSLPGFHAIKKFDSNGTLIAAWGTKGSGDDSFYMPMELLLTQKVTFL